MTDSLAYSNSYVPVIKTLAQQIHDWSVALGVSPTAMAGAIADEIDDVARDPLWSK